MDAVDLGFLTADEFVTRRSQTLIDNPGAKLNESYEIDQYHSKLNTEYRSEVSLLAQLKARPSLKNVRIIVTVIASREGSRIRHTLNTYVKQDLAHTQFEVIVLDNHKSDVTPDNTRSEIEKFQQDNPDITLIYAQKIWQPDEIATVGNARKYVFDMALSRIQARGTNHKDTIIISNDADTIDNDANYLSSILNKFDSDGYVEALVTPTGVPLNNIRKPNVYAALYLWDALDNVIADNAPRNLIGRSSAYRASMYAAVGGYNARGKMAGDLETGFLIADARGWDPHSVILFTGTKQVTDPRRVLESVASRIPINEMYYKFVSSPEVRDADNDELLGMIPDSLDWELFEEDADNFWDGGDTGMYKWRGDRFEKDFRTAMDNIGAEYRIEGNRLYLTNIDKLISNYEKEFGNRPEIIHSQRRAPDKARRKAIKQFFLAVSDTAIECRKRLAD